MTITLYQNRWDETNRPGTPGWGRWACIGLVCASLMWSVQAQAQEVTLNLPLRVDGFATVAGTTTNNKQVDYQGVGESWQWDADSLAGVQFGFPVDEQWSFTAQLVARGQDRYDAEMEWAFAKFAVSDQLEARAGRLRIPFFMFSDSLDVGYSYPWVRPPVDVYGQLGFSRFDGADLLARTAWGPLAITFQPYAGSTRQAQTFLGETGELDVTNLWGGNLVMQLDWAALRVGHTEGDFDLNGITALDNYLSGMRALGFPLVAQRFDNRKRLGRFSSVGLDLNHSRVRFLAEYTQRRTDGVIADTTGWYTTLALPLGNITPHITFSELETDEDYQFVRARLPAIAGVVPVPPQLTAEMIQALAQGTSQFVAMNTSNNQSLTLGVRWDIRPKVALKVEWQDIRVASGSMPISPVFSMAMNPLQGPTYRPGDNVHLYTVALDLVF